LTAPKVAVELPEKQGLKLIIIGGGDNEEN